MTKAIIGKKLGMTRIFDDKGLFIPVTLIKIADNIVTQIKNSETDGYNTVQLAVSEDKKNNRPEAGHLAKAKIKSKTIKEFPIEATEIGAKIDVNQFELNDMVTVQSVSKGKGFAGTVKRHNFHTGPKTHGSNNYRQPGSIGSAYPQRVRKGRRMSGHMGDEQTTVKNLSIVKIDAENNILMIKGAVPGSNKSTVYIWS